MKANTLYWVIGIVVIAVVGFGGYKLWHRFASQHATMQYNTTNGSAGQSSSTTGNAGLSNKTDTSNQQLDQDLQSVQSSMNQLQQDQGTANSDTNTSSQDTPVQ